MDKSGVLKMLPAKAADLFLDITEERVLGAGTHIEMIGDIFCITAEEKAIKKESSGLIKSAISAVAQYMIDTRGQASQAVTNAIMLMIKNMDKLPEQSKDFAVAIRKEIENFRTENLKNAERIIQFAKDELAGFKNYLVFDYSSTVAKYIRELSAEKGAAIYVPESRCIDGGHRYASIAAETGLAVRFFPDAALLHFLKNCEVALIGAETFYPDGTAFNTTGSDMLGVMCKNLHIPLYVLTPLLKVDKRAVKGQHKKMVMRSLEPVYGRWFTEAEVEKIDFICPELLPVGPEYIHAYITEAGVIAPGALFCVSMGGGTVDI